MEETVKTIIDLLQNQGLALFLVVWGVWFITQKVYPDIRAAGQKIGSFAESAADSLRRIADTFEGT